MIMSSSKNELDSRELLLLESEVKNKGKNMVIAYLLWWFVGIFGGHRFYLGKTGSAIAQLIISIFSFLTMIIIIGFITIIGVAIWVIVDAFLVHQWVKEHNIELEENIALQILGSRKVEA